MDRGSGAGAETTPTILSRMGCRVLTINAIPDGSFPGRLPEPSPKGLEGLAALVKSSGAAFGVAHDGDADRAVFIDEQGRFIEENQEFALIERFLCEQEHGTIVTPVSTSLLVEHIANSYGSEVVYTPVGSIYVARRMLELQEKGRTVIMGGEGNGGLIYPRHQYCRDGAMTAAMMVQILASTKEALSSLVQELPKYYMIKEKITTPNARQVIRQLEEQFSRERIDRTDGIKIIQDHAWALIRASGTEPLIRIMVESDRKDVADQLFQDMQNAVNRALSQCE